MYTTNICMYVYYLKCKTLRWTSTLNTSDCKTILSGIVKATEHVEVRVAISINDQPISFWKRQQNGEKP